MAVKRVGKYISILLFFIVMCLGNPIKVSAAVVVPASDDESGQKDYKNIMNALETERDIILEDGKTYYTLEWKPTTLGKDNEFGDEMEFKIVGATEANSLKGKISNESPVGKALIGKKVGDMVSVETQVGVVSYKVLDIQKSV